jgi:hypothetical protein
MLHKRLRFVALFQVGVPGISDKVDGFGGASDENDFCGVFAVMNLAIFLGIA